MDTQHSTPSPSPGSSRPLGIIAALPQELTGLIDAMRADTGMRVLSAGRRDYYVGRLWGTHCVLTLARIGKVAAAATVTAMIHQFDVAAIVFAGVAGSTSPDVHVGDVVVANALMQHDLDASPLFPRYEVPLLGIERFATDTALSARLANAAATFLRDAGPTLREHFGEAAMAARVHSGLIVSGDRFIVQKTIVSALHEAIPDALAVEMEGAAVAQVCYEYETPCAVLRTISDSADEAAPESFAWFLEQMASRYSYSILKEFLGTA